ncbi:Hypothetical predicted protein, partial [Olea europaea subsp. europaea]
APRVVSEAEHEVGGPSHQFECHEAATMPVYISYQRGSRPLFAAENQVLSPPAVEGPSLPTSAPQEKSRGKEPVHDDGPLEEPSSKERLGLFSSMTMTMTESQQMRSLER